MMEIKPTWRIAQEISRRHTIISLKITLPLLLTMIIGSIIVLKILGYNAPGETLKLFYNQYHQPILSVIIFIHLIPVNFYAIIRVFQANFNDFELKIIAKESQEGLSNNT